MAREVESIPDKDKPTVSRKLPLRTVYYQQREVTKVNRASRPISAVSRCTEHMRRNSYAANVAEVYDTRNGKLHAVVKRSVSGDTHILYQAEYDPKKDEK